jgi:chemotaxis protein CheD
VGLVQSTVELPKPLPGFEGIQRYWDSGNGTYAAKILPGEYYVTSSYEMITTVLGSCVSACVRDPASGIGGMNHFMLPYKQAGGRSVWEQTWVNSSARYGNWAMEHLINDIIKHGGRRENMEVKVFGGGRVIASMLDVGRRNIDFVMDYLRTEGLSLAAKDVGDVYARKVNFFPKTGRVMTRYLRSLHHNTIIDREQKYLHYLEEKPTDGEIDLWLKKLTAQ